MRMRRAGSGAVAAIAGCAALGVPLFATGATGDLDPSFGKRGTSLAQVDSTGSGAARIAVMPNGKLIAAGVGFDGLGEDTDADFAVVGFSANGKLDKRFGKKGASVFDFGEDYVWELPNDLAITADRKLLVGGSTEIGDDFDSAAGVARLTADGSFDDSLAGDGTLGANPEGLEDASAVVPLADGDFLVAGPSGKSVAVARFNADGSLDAAYAGDGVATHDLGGQARVGRAVVDGGGGIVVAVGSSAIGKDGFGLVRFGADGTFDAAFGNGGMASGDGRVDELALAPGGKLVAAGGKSVSRFDSAGDPDKSFAGDGGFAFAGPKRFGAEGLAVAENGSLVLAGAGGRKAKHFAVARVKRSGKLDRRFGDGGFAIANLGGQEAALGVALQGDDIVAAGRAKGRNLFIGGIGGRDTKVALARFRGR